MADKQHNQWKIDILCDLFASLSYLTHFINCHQAACSVEAVTFL
jgi:hypothetical protein